MSELSTPVLEEKKIVYISTNDPEFSRQLRDHLSHLVRSGKIELINEVGRSRETISDRKYALERANIFLLLLTSKYLADDYLWKNEVEFIVEKHHKKEALCIPIMVQQCNLNNTILSTIDKVVYANGKSVNSHLDVDSAWVAVVHHITEMIEKFQPLASQEKKTEAVSSKAEQEVKEPKPRKQRQRAKLTPLQENSISSETVQTTIGELFSTQVKLHSDTWSTEDLLGYDHYARVISQIIQSEDSTPPLTIAIIAPWGHGKTTLMRYTKEQIEGKRDGLGNAIKVLAEQELQQDTKVQYAVKPGESEQQAKARFIDEEVKNRELQAKTRAQQIETWLKEYRDKKQTFNALLKPTIWFNPWQYQSSQQIWSGMAHAIINQLVEKLPKIKQEEFWLKLHLKRVDQHSIRKEIYKTITIRLIPNLLVFLTGMILLLSKLGNDFSMYNMIFSLLLMLGTATDGVFAWIKENAKGFEESYDNFFRSPDYESEKGMFHEVNEDLKIVFELLAKDQKVIIFIDDLDRCSPTKIVEVIEAINLMMNGDYHKDCYFVIGMDAQVVAAALDACYKDLHGKLADRERMQGSIGWYFLDKFIQLPFFIPSIKESTKRNYLAKLFHQQELSPEEKKVLEKSFSPKDLEKAAQDILEAQSNRQEERIKEIRQEFDVVAEKGLDQAILVKAFESNRDSTEILDQVHAFSTFLEDSPRSLKRFANMLRFYSSMQQLRNTKKMTNASTEALGKWLTITLRWPQMVRWIQWAHEEKFQSPQFPKDDKEAIFESFTSTDPMEKAATIDAIFRQINVGDKSKKEDEEWKSIYAKKWIAFCTKNEHLPWLKDKELFQLLYAYNSPETSLTKALETDVW